MKWGVYINIASVSHYKLDKDTNFDDWAVIEFIRGFNNSPKSKRLNGKPWINYKNMLEEMPLLRVKTKSGLSNIVKKLESLGLIDCERDSVGKLYACITALTYKILEFNPVHEGEQQAQAVHHDDQLVHPGEQTRSSGGTLNPSNRNLTINLTNTQPSKTKGVDTKQTWEFYAKAYLDRHNSDCLRNAMVNTQMKRFVEMVGMKEAPYIVSYYLTLNDNWYLKKYHDVATLLQNAQAIRTQWLNNSNQTSIDHRNSERKSNSVNVYNELSKEIQEGKL
jgi:hypothetical protein